MSSRSNKRPHSPTASPTPAGDGKPTPPTGAAPGTLTLVSTPIGNLEDITLRALRVLREADLIAAEDTRRAGILLAHFEIKKPVTSYHAHNEHYRTAGLLAEVSAGKKVAIVCDAGTPGIADPGFLLVREALRQGIEPQVIPGPSAVTYALGCAGLPMHEFVFGGFLPDKTGKRRTALRRLADTSACLVLFEGPHRVSKLLTEINEVLGGETQVVIVREATKLFEERLRGSAAELLAKYGERHWKGEVTVVLHAGTLPELDPERMGSSEAPEVTDAAHGADA